MFFGCYKQLMMSQLKNSCFGNSYSYSSQNQVLVEPLDMIGLNELELAGGGCGKCFPKPRVVQASLPKNHLISGRS